MYNKRFYNLIFIIIIVIFELNLCAKKATDTTWLVPEGKEQLNIEGYDDQMGFGKLFIPIMTNQDWEPNCKIYYNKNKVIKDLKLGKSIFLKPGSYRVIFGSAEQSYDQIQKQFIITEQETTIIDPDWSCLLVNIVNENREKIRSGYEIYHLKSDIFIGSKYSKEDNEYSDLRSTWVLQPGKYKLVKNGEPYNTIKNFTTFELKKGELTKITVVINEETDTFIGAGELDYAKSSATTLWKNNIYIKGSFDLSGDNSTDQNDQDINLNFKGRIYNQLKYDIKPWYLLFKQNLNSGWLQTENDKELQVNIDELELENTAIYYFTDIFGLYSSVDLSSKVFPSREYFSSKKDVSKTDKNGKNTTEIQTEETIIANSGTPLKLSEGIGFNFTLLKSSTTNLYIRTGIGFVQEKNDGVYTKNSESTTLVTYSEMDNSHTTGGILTTGADLQLSSTINYTTTTNLFYKLSGENDFTFDMDNTLKFKFFKYLSLEYSLNINYDSNSETDYIIYDNQLALEFSYYMNY